MKISAYLRHCIFVDDNENFPEFGRWNALCDELFQDVSHWVSTMDPEEYDITTDVSLLSTLDSVKANAENDEGCALALRRYKGTIAEVHQLWSQFHKRNREEMELEDEIQALIGDRDLTLKQRLALEQQLIASKKPQPKKKAKTKADKGETSSKGIEDGRKQIEDLQSRMEQLAEDNKNLTAALAGARSDLGQLPAEVETLKADIINFQVDAKRKRRHLRRAVGVYTDWKDYALRLSGMLTVIVTAMDEDKRPPIPHAPTTSLNEGELGLTHGAPQSHIGGHIQAQQGDTS